MSALKRSLLFLAVLFLFTETVSAQTGAVPAGRRAFNYQFHKADIPGKWNENGTFESLDLEQTLDLSLINEVPAAKEFLENVELIAPDKLDQFKEGYIQLSPKANVAVNVFSLAFGASEGFMLAGVLPLYKASVNFSGGYTSLGGLKQAANYIEANSGEAPTIEQQVVPQVLRQLKPISAGNLQWAITEMFKYKPLGNWNATGIGDVRLFAHYKAVDGPIYRNATRFGTILPTGRTDDPDNLVDIPFGKGHYVTYIQSLNDFYFNFDYGIGKQIIFTVNPQFDFQWSHRPEVRLPASSDFLFSADKEVVKRTPGHILTLNSYFEVNVALEGLNLVGGYTYQKKWKDKIEGDNKTYDYKILSENSWYESHAVEYGFSWSTVSRFMKNQFPMPFWVGLYWTRYLGGVNVEKTDIFALKYEMYF